MQFKTFAFLVVTGFIISNWGKIHDFMAGPPDFVAKHTEEVVLYATSWCGYCQKTREYLQANGIPYQEYDIERSSEGHRQYKELHGNGVPLLLVKNNVIRGYNPRLIEQSMKQQ